jgi:hypothetical protein
MKFATISIIAVAMSACLAGGAQAGTIQVVNAGDEYATFHPKKLKVASEDDFHTTMNKVFGEGRWRQTSGYRTQAQEDELRRQGAGTVAPGHTSRHSIGGPEAPGAYDAVVDHLPLSAAAAKLRSAGGPFSRVLAEGAHGSQGAHLHVELIKNAPAQKVAAEPVEDTIYLRAVNGKRNPALLRRRGSGAATD